MGAQIAIIIPAYNAHGTIKSLLHSIACQTDIDICKIIIIDDADEKNYNYLYNDFPSLDMIILQNEENVGPGLARNRGIEKAIALNIPYIMFADADDVFYSPLAIQLLMNTLINSDSDLICSSFYEELQERLVIHEDYDIWLFGKIYRTCIIKDRNIRFPSIGINEDVCFNLWYWLSSNKKSFIKEVLYLWRNNSDSITRRNNAAYTWESFIPLCENLITTYSFILMDDGIPKDKVIVSIANRLIRLYGGYNTACGIIDDRIDLSGMMDALKALNKAIIEPFWEEITDELMLGAWNELSESLEDFYPVMGLKEFIKKIRED